MRAFHAIGAAFLMAWMIPVAGHADGTPAASTVSSAPGPGCHCPRQAWRPHRHLRYHARYWRHGRPVPTAVALWPAYNPPLPSPYDSAYDRVHTQYMHAREWGGEYLIEPPYVPRPPLPGLPHFRVAASGAVYEYDIMADGYVQLAQRDAQRALASVAPTP
jgi:hypothetical protein